MSSKFERTNIILFLDILEDEPSSSSPSLESTRPISRSRVCSHLPSLTPLITTRSAPTTRSPSPASPSSLPSARYELCFRIQPFNDSGYLHCYSQRRFLRLLPPEPYLQRPPDQLVQEWLCSQLHEEPDVRSPSSIHQTSRTNYFPFL